MQLLATARGIRALDRRAIGAGAVPGLVLMENAGRAFTDILASETGGLNGRTALVVCGKGNNGGDGFVIGRHLLNRGCRVHVALLAPPSALAGDAAVQYRALLGTGRLAGPSFSRSVHRTAASVRGLPAAEVIVDALFGTGFDGAVRGPALAAIRAVNRRTAFVASVDVPSGVNATTGTVENAAVRADLTVTMGLAKTGLYLGRGRECAGKVVVAEIGFPAGLLTARKEDALRVERADLRALLPQRPHDAHKYAVGKVYVLGGSRALTGAPLMTASAALRSGAGASVLGVPGSVHAVVARRALEVMIDRLPETGGGAVAAAAAPSIGERARWADAVAAGPGLTRDPETAGVVRGLLALERPLVLDADALPALRGAVRALRRRKSPTVLTPHEGEFRALTGVDAGVLERDRVGVLRFWAARLRCVILLKGSPTLVAEPGGHVWFNSTGNPGMATAGAGDVLTGVVAALLAQGLSASQAAVAAAYIHGLAGDVAAETMGERSLMARDILDALPEAFGRVERA
jgi:NAD(P)H-hydrate epimerase